MTTHEQLTSVVERLISKIENNETGAWIKPFGNTFNLWGIAEEKNYSSNFWMTYNQIKGIGGSVKKDEKASPVLFDSYQQYSQFFIIYNYQRTLFFYNYFLLFKSCNIS
jgi:antirestriction protein ArdC